VALATDYDDHIETAHTQTAALGETCHVALPVWVSTDGRPDELDWLLGSARRNRSGSDVSWQWLNRADSLLGPLVVKLQGSTRMPFASEIEVVRGTLTSRGDDDAYSIGQAVLYDEHERLTAMRSFERLLGVRGDNTGSVVSRLSTDKGLSWRGRSLLVLGQQFADWVPRLRLFSQRWTGEPDARGVSRHVNHWAIDRDFDWPERALLDSLGITMLEGELEIVSRVLEAELKSLAGRLRDDVTEIFTGAFQERGVL
jgi:hypothetical protein